MLLLVDAKYYNISLLKMTGNNEKTKNIRKYL